ncbi:MAG: hypothetical protein ACFFD4_12255 [Candidatus Odinarchaeota archaeon]
MTDEFRSKYGNMASRIHMLSITQGERIQEIAERITILDQCKGMDQENINFLATLYVFVITEEVLLVPPSAFLADFFEYARLQRKQIDQLDRNEVIGALFSPFVRSLVLASKIIFEMTGYLINRLGIGWKIEMIQSFILNDYYKPMIQKAAEITPNIDARFVAAMTRMMAEDYIDRRTRILEGKALSNLSITRFYKEFLKLYPLDRGDDIHFDLAWKLVFLPMWDKTMILVELEVEKFKEKVQLAKEEMEQHYEAEKKRTSTQYTDDFYLSMIQMKLYEIFKGKQDIDDQKERSIINAVDVMIRRYAIDKYGKIGFEKDELVGTVVKMLYGTVKDYPIIAGALLDYTMKPVAMRAENASEFLEEHDGYLRKEFIKRLTTGHKDRINAMIMAEEFVKLLKEAKKLNFIIGAERKF